MKQETKPKVKVNGRHIKMEVCPKFLRALREMGGVAEVECGNFQGGPEPAMTTNKPEVVAWEVRTISNPNTQFGTSPSYPEWAERDPDLSITPLVKLSDYEALRDEFESLRTKTGMSLGVGDGTGNLFVHGDYDSIKRVQALIFEFEKLRKASSELANWCFHEVGVDIELTPGLKQVMDITGDAYDSQ